MTSKQLTLIHVLAHKAWQAHVFTSGHSNFADSRAEDAWRRDELEAVTGKRSSKGLSQKQFEDACLHYAVIAGDEASLRHFADAEERRWHYQIHRWMRFLGFIRGEVVGWSYVRSIMDRMSLPERLDDVPTEQLQPILFALDTHTRRICDKLGIDSPKSVRDIYESGDAPRIAKLADWLSHQRERAGIDKADDSLREDFHAENLCGCH